MLFGNYTPRAQQVIQLARTEAERSPPYVGTEHMLLGLIALGQGVAVTVLEAHGVSLENVRMEVEKAVGQGPETKTVGSIPSRRAPRRCCTGRHGGAHAQPLLHRHEHILLGFCARRRRGGPGAANLNVDLETTRSRS